MATNNKNFVIKNGVEVNNDSFFTNADVTFYGATSGRDIIFRNSDNQLRFKDNVKAVFGTDGHFQIFHNSSAAWLQNYTGNMEFQTPSGSHLHHLHTNSPASYRLRNGPFSVQSLSV